MLRVRAWVKSTQSFCFYHPAEFPIKAYNVNHYEPLFFSNTFMNKINSHLFDCSVKSCKNKSSDSDFIFIQIHNAHKKREDLYLSSLDKWKDVSLEFIFTNDVLNLQDQLWWSQHLQFPRPPFFLWQFLTVDDSRGVLCWPIRSLPWGPWPMRGRVHPWTDDNSGVLWWLHIPSQPGHCCAAWKKREDHFKNFVY